ncbi:MAG: TetR family transcriptional regulator [Dichotomicrobium sp.]
MLDDMTDRSRLIKAALALAEERGWNAVGLPDIAGRAGLSMAALRREFASKTAIIDAFRREVDVAVLEKSATTTTGDSARDRLFDVLMTRFEMMLPYRPALRRIADDLQMRPAALAALVGPAMNTQYWMLQAAGIGAEGPSGFARVSALMPIHAKVFRVWLEDDDPAMAKTMAALDRRLRRAEQFAMRANTICDTGMRILEAFSPRRQRGAEQPAGPGPAGEPPQPPPPQGPPPGPGGTAPNDGQSL